MPDVVDLRSDTVTRPTPAMRRAMAEAEVGDDDYGEDPTVRALEEAFAERVGKPAALFVASGVMANQIAVRVLTTPGTAVVAGRRQHLVSYEYGAAALNSGVQFIGLDDGDGMLAAAEVRWARQAVGAPPTGRVAGERREHAHGGVGCALDRGAVWPRWSRPPARCPSTWTGPGCSTPRRPPACSAAQWASAVTTVMCCLSKGLCAPVGSLLAGDEEVMEQARLERKRLGGGMRQAGVLAAPGLVALRDMVERLPEDHRRAARLAEAVATRWPGCGLDPASVRTNIVTFDHPEPDKLLAHLEDRGVLAHAVAPGVVRFVTHHDVDDAGIERALVALADAPGPGVS